MNRSLAQRLKYPSQLRCSAIAELVRPLLVPFVGLLAAALISGCSLMAKQGEKQGRRVQQDEVTYQVARGDTLQRVSAKFGIPAKVLQRFNGISDPRSLRIGQTLRIPAVGPIARSASYEPVGMQSSSQRPAVNGERMVSIREVRPYLGKLKSPVEQARYTSSFGWRWGRFHEGMDLAAKEGEKVLASHDGTVVFVSDAHGRYGKMVVIKGEKLLTVYGHNSVNRVDLGKQVKRGEWIADVGSTGNATGPHLHLETRILDETGRWAAVDPMIFYKRSAS